jgi:hypothetical protein
MKYVKVTGNKDSPRRSGHWKEKGE